MPGKKGKSKQSNTISLDEFIAKTAPEQVNAISLAPNVAAGLGGGMGSWADEPFDARGGERPSWERRDRSPNSNFTRGGGGVNLGEGPDFSKVPDEPPYKAFVTNVSYNATREDLKQHFGDDIKSIYMINNEDGNFKGSANIEFFARESLVQALHLHASNMLGRTIRVEVSTSQGRSRNDRDRMNNSDRDRDTYGGRGQRSDNPLSGAPPADIPDDSWTRGQDFRKPTSDRASYQDRGGRDNFDRDGGGGGGGSDSNRYVPPIRRGGDRDTAANHNSSNNNTSSSAYRPPALSNYSNDRYSNDRDNRNNSSRFDSSRNNYDSRDSRGGGGGYERYDRRVPEDPARYNDSYDSRRRGHNSGDNSDRYYNDSSSAPRNNRNGDVYGSGYESRNRRERGDSFRSDYDQESSRRDDRYYDDRAPPAPRDGNYRDASPPPMRSGKSNENLMNRSAELNDIEAPAPPTRERNDDDYYDRSVDNYTSGGPLSSRSSNQENGGVAGVARGSDQVTPPYNSTNDDRYPSSYPDRNRTNSQRSGDSYGAEGSKYTLEGSDSVTNRGTPRNGGGYSDYESSDRYNNNASRNRYNNEPPERGTNNEHERRYERYQNDIAAPRANDSRRRTESGSGSNLGGGGGYDSRRNDSGRDDFGGNRGGGGYRDYNSSRDGNSRGGSYGGPERGGGYRERSDRYNDNRDSYRDTNRGYGGGRGSGGGGYNRSDHYERRDDNRRGGDGMRRGGGGPYSPNKPPYSDERDRYDSYNSRTSDSARGASGRPRLELDPPSRKTTEIIVPKEADVRPASIFGAAKPVDTMKREQEILARKEKATSKLHVDVGIGKGSGGGGSNAYRPPHAQRSNNSNNNTTGPPPQSNHSGTQLDAISPENKFSVLNADDDDDY